VNATNAHFVHQQRQFRVIFETANVRTIAEETDRLGCKRIVVIASRRHLPQLGESLGERVAGVIDHPAMHVPVEHVDEAEALAISVDADGAVASAADRQSGWPKRSRCAPAYP
jgi:maleylacetate reductase